MRLLAVLVVLVIVAWLGLREATATPPGSVRSASQAQGVVDGARRQVDAANARQRATP